MDARDPHGYRCYGMESTIVAASEVMKRIVLALSKVDMMPEDVVAVRDDIQIVAFRSTIQKGQRRGQAKIIVSYDKFEHFKSWQCKYACPRKGLLPAGF